MFKVLFCQKIGVFGSYTLSGWNGQPKNKTTQTVLKTLMQNPDGQFTFTEYNW